MCGLDEDVLRVTGCYSDQGTWTMESNVMEANFRLQQLLKQVTLDRTGYWAS